MNITIHNEDNLITLQRLADAGERFDLIELDGPYGAGLEGWDILTEDQYLAHYTARLGLVARCLQPWGVAFLFGYPEGCAEIKTWARQTGTLHLRRWISWYLNSTAHAGRKIQGILVFQRQAYRPDMYPAFGALIRRIRLEQGLSLVDVSKYAADRGVDQWWHRGGNMYHETACGRELPSLQDFCILQQLFKFDAEYWSAIIGGTLHGLTDRDYIAVPPERAAQLNDAGLRSKPVGLYLDLFRPTIPPRETKRALILYGGSGNAAIAAGQLGYDVTVCETDPARCEYIKRRWAWKVEWRDETPVDDLGPLFAMELV